MAGGQPAPGGGEFRIGVEQPVGGGCRNPGTLKSARFPPSPTSFLPVVGHLEEAIRYNQGSSSPG